MIYGRPVKILLLLGSWVGGGAERVAVHLMNQLDPSRFDVRLGLLRASPPYLDQLEMDRVIISPRGESHFRYEGPNRQIFTPMRLVGGAIHGPRAFRDMIDAVQPDVVMSFLKGTAILTWLALTGTRQRPLWVAREGNNVLAVADNESPNRLVKRASLALTRCAYQRADAVLANSSDMASDLIADLALEPAQMRLINNPIDIRGVRSAALVPLPEAPNRPFILTAGRLEYQKGQEVLIRGFADSGLQHSHDLVILGSGSRQAELEALAASLGVNDCVRFKGFVTNPYSWMSRADLFVLSSRWEGFPNAAGEAMAAGAPLVLSDCKFGPRDMIEPGISGELFPVDDSAALAALMAQLIADPARRAAMAEAGSRRVELFDISAMIHRYEDLFEELARKRALKAA
jgi:glycosyltransferase involved in cell wall biosynthesis